MRETKGAERFRQDASDPRHGTYNGYVNLRCRCAACCAANTAECQRHRQNRAGTLTADDPRHGKYTTYYNYKCRCDRCVAAKAAYDRDLYARRKRAS